MVTTLLPSASFLCLCAPVWPELLGTSSSLQTPLLLVVIASAAALLLLRGSYNLLHQRPTLQVVKSELIADKCLPNVFQMYSELISNCIPIDFQMTFSKQPFGLPLGVRDASGT